MPLAPYEVKATYLRRNSQVRRSGAERDIPGNTRVRRERERGDGWVGDGRGDGWLRGSGVSRIDWITG